MITTPDTPKSPVFVSVVDRNNWLESRTSSEALNNALLSGQEPDDYRSTNRLTRNAPRCLKPESIIAENLANFEQIEFDRLAPYRAIKDVMMEATKTERHTRWIKEQFYDPEGKLRERDKAITEYREVPDHDMRMKAARLYFYLCGLDPKIAQSVTVKMGNSGLEVNIGTLYSQTVQNFNTLPADQQIARYNEMQQQARSGTLIIPADYSDPDK